MTSASPSFRHGVASGDPTPDGVVLWTRCTPGPGAGDPLPVAWRVATDPDFTRVVAGGTAPAVAAADFTVHVEVPGLFPATTYWYGFEAGGVRSPTGRTRTAPAGPLERLRVGVVCCAHWTAGFFNAYRCLAARDVDVVVHLGDYLYEENRSRTQGVRLHNPPGRLRTLAEYRARHAQYKTDPDLRALHAAHPVAAVWDDHELGSNAWHSGSPRHDPEVDGPFEERRAAAVRAYREWMPLRPSADPLRLWRRLRFGDLCDLVLCDTRLFGRDRPAALRLPVVGIRRRDRALLGEEQWRWLESELAAEEAPRWRVLASQVVVAPIHLLGVPPARRRLAARLGMSGGGLVVNPGQWDGYPDERDRLLGLLGRRPGETVVVSGDLHSSWASQLCAPDGPAVAAEFTAPSVSAPDFAHKVAPPVPFGRRLLERVIASQNPHVRWVDTRRHGYVVLDVDPDRIEVRWWHVRDVRTRHGHERLGARFTLTHGDPTLGPSSC
ncbi:MAG: alkaline phosphatase D family protein [Acidimicrobiia bacterium]